MGFFKGIVNSLKEVEKNISEDLKKKQERINKKIKILEKFEINDLKKICKDYGIGEPSSYGIDDFTGEKHKIKISRDNFISLIMNKLTLEQIETFCNKNRLTDALESIKDRKEKEVKITKEETKEKEITSIEIKKQSEFEEILDTIDNNFQIIGNVINEEDFKKQLVQFLTAKYSNKIKIEKPHSQGRADILIDNKYLLELKIAKNKEQLRNLKGQIHDYKKDYENVAVILLDVGKITSSDIQEYLQDYENFGAKTLVINAVLSKKKNGRKQINIKI